MDFSLAFSLASSLVIPRLALERERLEVGKSEGKSRSKTPQTLLCKANYKFCLTPRVAHWRRLAKVGKAVD
jgi:hypothetical protein